MQWISYVLEEEIEKKLMEEEKRKSPQPGIYFAFFVIIFNIFKNVECLLCTFD